MPEQTRNNGDAGHGHAVGPRRDRCDISTGSHLHPAARELLVLGVVSVVAYLVFWLPKLWLWREGDDPFSHAAIYIGTTLGWTWGAFGRYMVMWLVPFVLYLLAVRIVRQVPERQALRIIVGVGVTAALVLLLAYPALAADPFGWLMYGRIISEYGGNPYVDLAVNFPNDVYSPPVGGDWRAHPAPYGPVAIWLTAGITAVAGSHTMAALLLLKAAMVACFLGVGALIWRLARLLRPDDSTHATVALLAWLWNPMLLTHIALDAHNDVLMLLALLGALLAARRERWLLAFPLLSAAVLVKFIPLLLGPLFLLAAWPALRDRTRRWEVLGGLAGGALLAALLYAPLWSWPETVDSVRAQSDLYTSSPGSLLRFVLVDDWLRPLSVLAFGMGYLLILWRVRGLEARSFGVLLLYLCTLSFWTKGWYFAWPLALGAALGGWPLRASIAASAGVFLQNGTAWAWEMDWQGLRSEHGRPLWELFLTATIYLPWLLLPYAWFLQRRQRATDAPTPPATI